MPSSTICGHSTRITTLRSLFERGKKKIVIVFSSETPKGLYSEIFGDCHHAPTLMQCLQIHEWSPLGTLSYTYIFVEGVNYMHRRLKVSVYLFANLILSVNMSSFFKHWLIYIVTFIVGYGVLEMVVLHFSMVQGK